MDSTITPGQSAILSYVDSYTHAAGYPPTLREISSKLEKSLATIRQRIAALKKKGLIVSDEGTARSLRTNVRNSNNDN
jgi:SOS-response transcriptional repressor LexA